MSKFAVGEIAIIRAGDGTQGLECEVVATPQAESWKLHGIWVTAGCYVIDVPARPSSKGYWLCVEEDLRKRPQRGLPDSVTTIFKQPRAVEA